MKYLSTKYKALMSCTFIAIGIMTALMAQGARGDKIDIGAHQTDLPGWTSIKWIQKMQNLVLTAPINDQTTTWPTLASKEWAELNKSSNVAIQFAPKTEGVQEWTTDMPVSEGSYLFRLIQTTPPADPSILWTFDMFPEDYGTLNLTKSVVVVTANSTKITYGQSLSASTLIQITSVPGIFAWETPNVFPEAGSSNEYKWIFTPTQGNIAPVWGKSKVLVAKAPLAINAINSSSTYGDHPTFSSVVSGFVRGETADSLHVVVKFTSDANNTSNVGNYTVTPHTDAVLNNYDVSCIKGIHTITQKMISATEITITINAENVYTGTPFIATVSCPANISGDLQYAQGGVALSKAPQDVGKYQVSYILNGNFKYVTGQISTVNYSITPAIPALSVSATAITYGDLLKTSALSYIENVKGQIAWNVDSAKLMPTCADSEKLFVWEFKSNEPNYKNTTGQTKMVIHSRAATIKPKDLIVLAGTSKEDVEKQFEAVISNMIGTDQVKDIKYSSDYQTTMKEGETASIEMTSLDTTLAPNHTFTVQKGSIIVGSPNTQMIEQKYVATQAYGTPLKEIAPPFTTSNTQATIRWNPAQANLLPSVKGESYTAELIWHGVVLNSKQVVITTQYKRASLSVVCNTEVVYGTLDLNPSAKMDGFLSPADVPAYSFTSSYTPTSNVNSTFMVDFKDKIQLYGNYLINYIPVVVRVVPRQLKDVVLTQKTNPAYTGGKNIVDFNIIFEDKQLVMGTDYTVSPAMVSEAGDNKVTVAFKGNFTGTHAAIFTIEQNKNIVASLEVKPQTYGDKTRTITPIFKCDGVNVNYVDNSDYDILFKAEKGENINPVEVGTYKVVLSAKGMRIGFPSVEAVYSIVPKTVIFVVSNNEYDFDEMMPDVKRKASVTPNDKGLIPGFFNVTYQDEAKIKSESQTAIGSYPIFVEVKDPNYTCDSTIALDKKLEIKQFKIPEVYFAASTPRDIILKEIQEEFGYADSVYLVAQASGPINDTLNVKLNLFGSAVKGVNFEIFDSQGNKMPEPAFSFTSQKRSDSILFITKDDRSRTPDLNSKIDLISTDATIIRPAGMSVNVVITDLKDPVDVNQIGFNSITPIEMKSSDIDAKLAILAGLNTEAVYVTLAGAKVGSDVELYDARGGIVSSNTKGHRIPVDNGYAGFTLRIKDPNFIEVGKNKVMTLHIVNAEMINSAIAKIDQSRKKQVVHFINDAPIAFSDELGVDPENALDGFELLVLHNDVKYDKYTTPLYVRGMRNEGENKFSSEIMTSKFAVAKLNSDGRLTYYMPAHFSKAGYKDTFEYEVAQDGGGVSFAKVTVTVGERHVKNSIISVIPPPEMTIESGKLVSHATYIDPLNVKASIRKREKKVAVKAVWTGIDKYQSNNMKANLNETIPERTINVSIKSNIKGVNKRALSNANKAGCFLADMRKVDSIGNFFYDPDNTSALKANSTAVEARRQLVQVKSIGLNIKLKGSDSDLVAVNVAGAESMRLADSTYTMNKNGQDVPEILPIYYKTDRHGVNTPIAITLNGDIFGVTPKFYFEYKTPNKNTIKKLSLSRKRSVSFTAENGIKHSVKRPSKSIKPAKGSQEWIGWPHKNLNKLLDNGVTRFDLIVDNGSILGVKAKFDVKEINKTH